jgi:hypothetical protein
MEPENIVLGQEVKDSIVTFVVTSDLRYGPYVEFILLASSKSSGKGDGGRYFQRGRFAFLDRSHLPALIDFNSLLGIR